MSLDLYIPASVFGCFLEHFGSQRYLRGILICGGFWLLCIIILHSCFNSDRKGHGDNSPLPF